MHEQEKEVISELDRSRKALRSAQILYKAALYEDALSRSYYTVLHAAKAGLCGIGLKANSHEGVKRFFGKHLIQTERIEKEYAIIFREEQDDRLLADYDVTFEPKAEQVRIRIENAERFLKRITRFLKEKGFPVSD